MLRARGAMPMLPRLQLIQQSSTYLSTFQQQGSATMNQRTAYIEKMELQLDKLNKKMVGLETSAQEAKEEARQTYKDEMGKLRHQSKVAVAKLDQLKAASVDSWEELVTDMEKMHDAFTHSIFSLFQAPTPSSPKTDAEKKDGSTAPTKKD
jgi:predicted  nucleic acid-binding Zn-ribbon protein